jgi:hypothetical protein
MRPEMGCRENRRPKRRALQSNMAASVQAEPVQAESETICISHVLEDDRI